MKLRHAIFFTAIVGLLVLLEACGSKPTPQDSCNFVQNSDQQRVSWGSETPVVLYIDSSVPSQYFASIQAAAVTWNKSVGREVLKIGGWTSSGPQSAPSGKNTIFFQKDWDGPSTEQARTTIYWSGSRISEAHVKINRRDFDFFSGSQPIVGKLDMESLILHEFGHVLGLKHSTETQSVMVPTLSGATAANPKVAMRRGLSDFDIKSISCEY